MNPSIRSSHLQQRRKDKMAGDSATTERESNGAFSTKFCAGEVVGVGYYRGPIVGCEHHVKAEAGGFDAHATCTNLLDDAIVAERLADELGRGGH